MREEILVTGGAGFIGSHLVDALIARGHPVRVLDNLEPQVHGPALRQEQRPPAYLNPEAEFIYGDVRDRRAVEHALDGVSVVFHEAAAVGVGQSMYEIEKYVGVNTYGTAVLLDALSNRRERIRKLVVASSMSIYGEGAYECACHGRIDAQLRTREQLTRHEWEMRCPECGEIVRPAATDESKPLHPTSIYAISKRDQEEMSLLIGEAYRIPTVALRYFNVYGPRQALSNPYTGVAAIFSSRLLNDKPPLIFEDGAQRRDFVHVSDIVQANLLALECDGADYAAVNIGTGNVVTVCQVAEELARALDKSVRAVVTEKFREGDIRHCVSTIDKARRLLGYNPRISFREGMSELAAWVSEQQAVDGVEAAARELEQRGLAR